MAPGCPGGPAIHQALLCTVAAHRSASLLGTNLGASQGRKEHFLTRSFCSVLWLELWACWHSALVLWPTSPSPAHLLWKWHSQVIWENKRELERSPIVLSFVPESMETHFNWPYAKSSTWSTRFQRTDDRNKPSPGHGWEDPGSCILTVQSELADMAVQWWSPTWERMILHTFWGAPFRI